jgi:hypothetical protein
MGISSKTTNASIATEFSTSVVLLRFGGGSGTSVVTDGNPDINVSFAVNSVLIKKSIDSRFGPENYTYAAPDEDFIQIANLLTNGIDDEVTVKFAMGGGSSLGFGPEKESLFIKSYREVDLIGDGPDFAGYEIDFIRFSIKALTYTQDPPNLDIGWDSPYWEVWGSIPATTTTATATTPTMTNDVPGMTSVLFITMLTLITVRKSKKR